MCVTCGMRVYICLLSVSVSTSTTSWIDASTPAMMLHGIQLTKMYELQSIDNAASELALHVPLLPHRLGVVLPKRLMALKQELQSARKDHTWYDLAAHRICGSLIDSRGGDRGVCRHHNTTHFIPSCLCTDFDRLMLLCRHHIVPWASDSPLCANILAVPNCAAVHPLGHICSSKVRHREVSFVQSAKMGRRGNSLATTLEASGAHSKHQSWGDYHRSRESAAWAEKHRHVAMNRPKTDTDIRRSTVRRKDRADSRRSDTGIAPVIAGYVGRGWNHSFHRHNLQRGGNGTRVCLVADWERLNARIKRMHPTVRFVLTKNKWEMVRRVLDADECDIGVTWASEAELLFRHSCPIEMGSDEAGSSHCKTRGRVRHHGMGGLVANPASQHIHLTNTDHIQTDLDRNEMWIANNVTCSSMHDRSITAWLTDRTSPWLARVCS